MDNKCPIYMVKNSSCSEKLSPVNPVYMNGLDV